MLKHSPVFEATYSSVPVWEMNCSGVSVMRRRLDSYLNATQILKVAGVDKGRRTKILDKDVVGGLHEKVQGGFSKYQGTWIPFERGVQLAQEYKVETQMAPILAPDATRMRISIKPCSPAKASANDWPTLSLMPQPSSLLASNTTPVVTRGRRRCLSVQSALGSQPVGLGTYPQTTSQYPSRNVRSANACAPVELAHPYGGSNSMIPKCGHVALCATGDESNHARRFAGRHVSTGCTSLAEPAVDKKFASRERQRQVLMGLFLTDDLSRVPGILAEPGLDINSAIDVEGNTCVHWAAVLANMVVFDALYEHGADLCARNAAGKTPLMGAVVGDDGHRYNSFPALLRHHTGDSVLLADARRRTVLHHIALSCEHARFWPHAAYYLTTIKESFPAQLAAIANALDYSGATALSIAISYRAHCVAVILHEIGAREKPKQAEFLPHRGPLMLLQKQQKQPLHQQQ